jgi:hypothetical protein
MNHGEHDNHHEHGLHGPGCGDCLPQDAALQIDHQEHIHTGPGCCGEVEPAVAAEHVDHVHDEHCGHMHHKHVHEHVDHDDHDHHHLHREEPKSAKAFELPTAKEASLWQHKPIEQTEEMLRLELAHEEPRQAPTETASLAEKIEVKAVVKPVEQPKKAETILTVKTNQPKAAPRPASTAVSKPEPQPRRQASANTTQSVKPPISTVEKTTTKAPELKLEVIKPVDVEPQQTPTYQKITPAKSYETIPPVTPVAQEVIDDIQIVDQATEQPPDQVIEIASILQVEQQVPVVDTEPVTPQIEPIIAAVQKAEAVQPVVEAASEQIITLIKYVANLESAAEQMLPEKQAELVEQVTELLQKLAVPNVEKVILQFAKMATVVEWQDMLLKLYEELQGEDRFERGLKGLATYPVSTSLDVSELGKLIMRRLAQSWSLAC